MNRSPGYVVTFYSFKGGVGRSFALVDVAIYLARSGRRVLCVDWDLEAPGLEAYLRPYLRSGSRPGLLDVFEQLRDSDTDPATPDGEIVRVPGCGERLLLVRAGSGADYARRLQDLDWERLWKRKLLALLDRMRADWRREHDFVLIDSRTGLSDIGAICTIVMPEIVVAMFTPNDQSYAGIQDIISRVRDRQARLGLDRPRMRFVPVLSRLENNEYKDKLEWQRRVVEEMGHHVEGWDPEGLTPRSVLESIMVPYVPYFAYGERLAAIEDTATSAGTVGRAHAALAELLGRGLAADDASGPTESLGDVSTPGLVYVGPVSSRLTLEIVSFLRSRGFYAVTAFEEPVPKVPGMTRRSHIAASEEHLTRTMNGAVEEVAAAAAIVFVGSPGYQETPETLAVVERVTEDQSVPFIPLRFVKGSVALPASLSILDDYLPLVADEWNGAVREKLLRALTMHGIGRSLA